MAIIFNFRIRKYNKRGVGFIYLPEKHQNQFKVGQQLKIIVELPNNKIIFFAKLRKHNKAGVYVPASVAIKNNILGKDTKIIIEKSDGFFTKLSQEGIIYLPKQEAESLGLKQDEIVFIRGAIEEKTYSQFCRINVRRRSGKEEYFCVFNSKLARKEGVFKIISIISRNKQKIPNNVKKLISNFNYGCIDANRVILYYGNRVPVVIRTDFDFKKIVHFLGCYFADGTKRGNSWGICASTPKQAKLYLQMHNLLIENPPLNLEITYTDPFNEENETLRKRLCAFWLKNAEVQVPEKKVWIYKTEIKDAQNRNKYGALSMREYRQLTLCYYNKLLDNLVNEIVEHKNKKLALDFLCGVLEGDGAPSAKARGHVVIATNEKEAEILSKLFRVLDFKHIGYKEGNNRHYLRIGSIELIRNMSLLADKLFMYYPKRRKKLQERLANTGCVRFLLGNMKTSKNFIPKLKEAGILDKEGKLTEHGRKVRRDLRRFVNSH